MIKMLKEKLLKEFEKYGEVMCPVCGMLFDQNSGNSDLGESGFDALCSHFEVEHGEIIEDAKEKLSNVVDDPQNKETIEIWKEQKRKELLMDLSKNDPQLFHAIVHSPDDIADKLIEKELNNRIFRQALKYQGLTSFERKMAQAIDPNQEACPEGYTRYLSQKQDGTYESKIVKVDPTAPTFNENTESIKIEMSKRILEENSTEAIEKRKKTEMTKILYALLRDKELKKKGN
jgi:uncharacterized Zn finger protein (UPF0148 family)